jgi:glucose uptake protein GlcU
LPMLLLHLSLLGFCLVSKTFSFSAWYIILLSAVGMVRDSDQIFKQIFVDLYVLDFTYENKNVCVCICILWEDIFV